MTSESQQLLVFTADNIFRKYDINQNDKLDENQVACLLKDAFKEMGSREHVTSDRVKLFISRVDKDGDFKISKKELIEVLKENQWK